MEEAPRSQETPVYGWYGGGMNSGWGVVVTLFLLVFLVAAIVGVVGIVRWNAGPRRTDATSSESTAMSILKERFAKGEITEEEFRQRAEVIRRT